MTCRSCLCGRSRQRTETACGRSCVKTRGSPGFEGVEILPHVAVAVLKASNEAVLLDGHLCAAFSHSLIWTPPVCRAESRIMAPQGTGSSPISGLSVQAEACGPCGIRQERPHRGHALRGARVCSGLRSCGPTCLTITLKSIPATNLRRWLPRYCQLCQLRVEVVLLIRSAVSLFAPVET